MQRRSRRLAQSFAALAALTALVVPALAYGNMAAPNDPGQPLGEPSGELASLHIEREDLQLDLRPLVDGQSVNVAATYHIRNDGEQRSVPLVFVATALKDTGGVWLDGAPVAVEMVQTGSGNTPPAGVPWQAPRTTPVSGGTLSYSVQYSGTLNFALDIPPGQHEIRVEYRAEATRYSANSPALYWQLGYVLSPARQWASFGTLDVLVSVPADWYLATEPPLARTGEEARGTFTGVPADSLAITAQYPVPTSGPFTNTMLWVAAAIGLLLGVVLAFLVGRLQRRRGRGGMGTWPIALVYSAVAGIVVIFSGQALSSVAPIPSNQVAWTYSYAGIFEGIASFFTLLMLLVLFVILSTIVMIVVAGLAARGGPQRRAA